MSESVEAWAAPRSDDEHFAMNVRRLRESLGWSQGELAKRMRDAGWDAFHQTTVSRIEKGERPVKIGEGRALARVLGSRVVIMIEPPEDVAVMQDLALSSDEVRGWRYTLGDAAGNYEEARDRLRSRVAAAERLLSERPPLREEGLQSVLEDMIRLARGASAATAREVVAEALHRLEPFEATEPRWETLDGEHPEAP